MTAGMKSSEFYVTVLVIIGMVVDHLLGGVSAETAASGGGIAAAAYAVSRGLAKKS